MTFLSDLARLREAATKGPWELIKESDGQHIWGSVWAKEESGEDYCIVSEQHCSYNAELIAYLVNHAEAIEELVRAAENIKQIGCIGGDGEPWCKGDHHSVYCPAGIAAKALEKLNRSENET